MSSTLWIHGVLKVWPPYCPQPRLLRLGTNFSCVNCTYLFWHIGLGHSVLFPFVIQKSRKSWICWRYYFIGVYTIIIPFIYTTEDSSVILIHECRSTDWTLQIFADCHVIALSLPTLFSSTSHLFEPCFIIFLW